MNSMATCLFLFAFVLGAQSAGAVVYSYDPAAADGPQNWANVASGCGGGRQSPINILTADTKPDTLPVLKSTGSSSAEPGTLSNDKHSVKVSVQSMHTKVSGSGLLGNDYNLAQLHFHAPSEHQVNGVSYDLEVHYVHQHTSGHYAVVGHFYNTGTESDLLKPLIAGLSSVPFVGNTTNINMDFNYPVKHNDYWHYRGSLTTPTCDETVDWFVFQETQSLSTAQFDAINAKLDAFPSNRPVQPVNGRVVYDHKSQYSYNPAHSVSPANWGLYWPDCNGKAQSPINVVTINAGPLYGSVMSTDGGRKTNNELENLAHTLEVKLLSDTSSRPHVSTPITSGDKLLQYHMHSPSEHTVNGNFFDLEIHWVHQNAGTGKFTVIGVMYQVGAENPDLEPIVTGVASVPNLDDHEMISVQTAFSTKGPFYHYSGSFTTPPCTEIVDWFLTTEVQSISQAQLNTIKTTLSSGGFQDNNRPIQDRNNRHIQVVTALPGSGALVSASMMVMMMVMMLAF